MTETHSRRRRFCLHLTVFTGGLVSLALELSASRLLAPIFGTTDLIWSAIIGLILLYLSIGYVIGGRIADKYPHDVLLYTLTAIAGISIAFIPIFSQPVLRSAITGMQEWNLSWILGPFVVVLLLFVVPVTLLAFITPFATRLEITGQENSGKTTGQLYALSTAGSFIGTLLPNYLLIPWIGTRRTFLLLALLIQICALVGLLLTHRKRFWLVLPTLILIVAMLFLPTTNIKSTSGLIYEEESRYNYIQVVERDEVRYLLLNEGQGIHSMYIPFEPGTQDMTLLTGGPWDYYLIAPYFQAASDHPIDIKNLCIIGLAAGTSVTQFTDVYGLLPIDGIEIDPAIPKVGYSYFSLNQPNLTIHTGDGRTFLQTTDSTYSIIAIDAYRLPYIPWHLTTEEFFTQVHAHLASTGVTAINVGHTPDDYRLVDAMATTMKTIFADVYVIDVPDSFNTIIIGTIQPTTQDDFLSNTKTITDTRLRYLADQVPNHLYQYVTISWTFTDDRAPVEFMTNATALSYIISDR